MTIDQVGAFPARVFRRELPAELTRQIALPDSVTPFVFSAEISSDRLDAYFTHMAESTLKNFAADASAGVSFLDSHNHFKLGFGQSLRGMYEENRVLADFYTVPGVRFGGGHSYESTDDFIRAVESALVRDVSVGFYGGDVICDICGNSLLDWQSCPHWPGVEYAVGDKGEQTVVATATIEDARLAEVSAVYEGATPGAMIQRATEMADAGELTPEMTRRLEVKYRIKLPGAKVQGIGFGAKGLEAKPAPPSPIKEEGENVDELEMIRSILSETNAPKDTPLPDAVRWLIGENARLAPLAGIGNTYRADLTEAAIAEGIRAQGDKFPVETYRTMFASAPIDQIKRLLESWGGQAADVFTGERQTAETTETKQTERAKAPRQLYRV
jgi:hypothetical protein